MSTPYDMLYVRTYVRLFTACSSRGFLVVSHSPDLYNNGLSTTRYYYYYYYYYHSYYACYPTMCSMSFNVDNSWPSGMFWVINVEAHPAHCRMASIIIIIFLLGISGPIYYSAKIMRLTDSSSLEELKSATPPYHTVGWLENRLGNPSGREGVFVGCVACLYGTDAYEYVAMKQSAFSSDSPRRDLSNDATLFLGDGILPVVMAAVWSTGVVVCC